MEEMTFLVLGIKNDAEFSPKFMELVEKLLTSAESLVAGKAAREEKRKIVSAIKRTKK